MISWPLVRYVLMAALRDRLILSLNLLMVVGSALSIFLGTGALMEDDQFALVFAAAGLRFASVIGLVLFVVFYIRRAFDNKDVESLLSRPLSRTSFIISHSVAFSALALALTASVAVAICLIIPAAVGPGHALWLLSLLMELIIIANAALFFSMVLPSASSSAMAVLGLYILSRLMGQLLGIVQHEPDRFMAPVLGTIMNFVSMLVPRLDLMAQTSWMIYPDSIQDIGYGFVLGQGALYTALLVTAAVIDLRRRQF